MTNRTFTPDEKQVVDKFVHGFRAKLVAIELATDFDTLEKSIEVLGDALDGEDFAKDFEALCEKITLINSKKL